MFITWPAGMLHIGCRVRVITAQLHHEHSVSGRLRSYTAPPTLPQPSPFLPLPTRLIHSTYVALNRSKAGAWEHTAVALPTALGINHVPLVSMPWRRQAGAVHALACSRLEGAQMLRGRGDVTVLREGAGRRRRSPRGTLRLLSSCLQDGWCQHDPRVAPTNTRARRGVRISSAFYR